MNDELPSEKIVALKLAQLSWLDRYWILRKLEKKQRVRIKSILKTVSKAKYAKLSFDETNELINQATSAFTLSDDTASSNNYFPKNGNVQRESCVQNKCMTAFEGLPPFLYNYAVDKVNGYAEANGKITKHTQEALNRLIEDTLVKTEVSS